MGFQQGLSGLNASSRSLDVIGHNIANANTTGMKAGRAEFAELYASSLGLGIGQPTGLGVTVATVAQQFTQGSINVTSNRMDLAVNGNGFFQLTQADGSPAYTRAGNFKLDQDGFVKTNQGANVMGYPVDPDTGVATSVTTQAIKLPTAGPIEARQTTEISAMFNLDARAPNAAGAAAVVGPPAVAAIPPTPRTTYGTAITVYDAQGAAVPVNMYFQKTATANKWDVYTSLDASATPVGSLTFDATGKIVSATPQSASVTTPALDLTVTVPTTVNPNAPSNTTPTPGTGVIKIAMKVDKATQFGNNFAVADLKQNGYTSGDLSGVVIEADGTVTAKYSNGLTQAAGRVALANFRNAQGLSSISGSVWTETFASGNPVMGTPGQGNYGKLQAGALEESNVDLTAELVNMMTAQRSYQANAQTIKTQDQVLSTLVNMR